MMAAAAALTAASPSHAEFKGHYALQTIDAQLCKGGLHVGYAATARMVVGCLIKAAAGIDLDAPDAAAKADTVWSGYVMPPLHTAWQTNPRSALGKIDGFIPVRMEDASLIVTGYDANHAGTYTISGRWVSAANGQEKNEPITIVLTVVGGRNWLTSVTRP